MDGTRGIGGGKSSLRYQELLDRAGKGIEQLSVSLDTCEQRLQVVLGKEAPSTANDETEIQKELVPQCVLEELLLQLCQGIEMRLFRIQKINSQIQL